MRLLTALAALFFIACEEPTGPSEAAVDSAADQTETILDLPDGGMVHLNGDLAALFAPQGEEESWEVQLDPMELPGTQDSVDYEEGDPLLVSNIWYTCYYIGGGWWVCYPDEVV